MAFERWSAARAGDGAGGRNRLGKVDTRRGILLAFGLVFPARGEFPEASVGEAQLGGIVAFREDGEGCEARVVLEADAEAGPEAAAGDDLAVGTS